MIVTDVYVDEEKVRKELPLHEAEVRYAKAQLAYVEAEADARAKLAEAEASVKVAKAERDRAWGEIYGDVSTTAENTT